MPWLHLPARIVKGQEGNRMSRFIRLSKRALAVLERREAVIGRKTGPIFDSFLKKRWTPLRNLIRSWADGAPQSDRERLEDFRWHGLRHTFATRRMKALNLVEVQAELGHADPRMTARYAHPTKTPDGHAAINGTPPNLRVLSRNRNKTGTRVSEQEQESA